MKTTDLLREGQHVKVVRNPVTRHGISCHNRLSSQDCYLFAGEVGIVTRTPYTAHDGSPMVNWTVEFSRGRRVSLSVPESEGHAESQVSCFLLERDAENFRKVKG